MTTNEIAPRPGTIVTVLAGIAGLPPRTGRVIDVENGGRDVWVDFGYGDVQVFPPSWLVY